jgi:hypothetical protein
MADSTFKFGFVLLVAIWCLGGCASKSPSIAHTHIGHAMTGWVDTPNQLGLLVTAENAAKAALRSADRATAKGNDLPGIKANVRGVLKSTGAEGESDIGDNSSVRYGVRSALRAASDHITFAASSPDATENVRVSAKKFSNDVQGVVDRCDLILALGNEILQFSSFEEAGLLAGELHRLVQANVSGEDIDGDGVVGSNPEEYGIQQLRADLQAMIDREDPKYRTVDTWYLFNLVRLPSGEWIFRRFSSGGADSGGSSY